MPLPMLAPALALLLQAAPPPLSEQFRAEPPTHVLRIVRVPDGAVVRQETAAEGEETAFPAGEGRRILLALTGMETGALDPERRVPCDTTCWARGSHGEPNLMEAVAVGCDTWFRAAEERVPAAEVSARAVALGFPSAPAAEGGFAATPRSWTGFWRALQKGSLRIRGTTASNLLVAAGLGVSSPRGQARTLHDPRRRVRVFAGAAPGGAWVTGLVRRGDDADWAFALWVPEATVPLAVARASALLDETLRRRDDAAAERGAPLTPLDEER